MTTIIESEFAAEVAELTTEREEAQVVSLATRIAAATYRFLVLLGELEAREAWAQWGCASCAQWLSWRWDDDSALLITARLEPEAGALLWRRCTPRSNHPERGVDGGQRYADALAAMADRALASGPVDRSGADRTTVIVHVDAEVLTKTGDGACHLEDGPALAAETARRLACDATLVAVAGPTGAPMNVGCRGVSAETPHPLLN